MRATSKNQNVTTNQGGRLVAKLKKLTAPRRGQQALRLRDVRLALGLSQIELAQRADLPSSLYNMYETGRRRLTLDSAMRIRETFGIPLDYLMYGDRSGLPERIARLIPTTHR